MARLDAEGGLRAALRDGETVLETFIWMRHSPLRWTGMRWAVLTTERLLLFHNGFGSWKLNEALERSDIQDARTRRDRFAVRLKDGKILKVRVGAPTAVMRVAQNLSESHLQGHGRAY